MPNITPPRLKATIRLEWSGVITWRTVLLVLTGIAVALHQLGVQ